MTPGTIPAVNREVAERLRRAKALRLRADGATYAEIAAAVGYAGPSGAYKAVMRAIPELDQQAALDLRRLQLARLDDLLLQVWPMATNREHPRHLSAVTRALAVMQRIDALTGLDR
jgi:hypothetical protein